MKEKKRVVFDTNVYISLFGFPGQTAMVRLWELAVSGRFDLFVSPFILEEFQVVGLTKFHHSESDMEFFMERIINVAKLVYPSENVNVIPQKHPDNKILSCALAAEADFLVTGDKKHLVKLNTFKGISIFLPAEFLNRI